MPKKCIPFCSLLGMQKFYSFLFLSFIRNTKSLFCFYMGHKKSALFYSLLVAQKHSILFYSILYSSENKLLKQKVYSILYQCTNILCYSILRAKTFYSVLFCSILGGQSFYSVLFYFQRRQQLQRVFLLKPTASGKQIQITRQNPNTQNRQWVRWCANRVNKNKATIKRLWNTLGSEIANMYHRLGLSDETSQLSEHVAKWRCSGVLICVWSRFSNQVTVNVTMNLVCRSCSPRCPCL